MGTPIETLDGLSERQRRAALAYLLTLHERAHEMKETDTSDGSPCRMCRWLYNAKAYARELEPT
ncbi:MAG: hypothetical protein ACOYXR_10315 [Nitrospirota bacterium]|jgi:hypothetical protein